MIALALSHHAKLLIFDEPTSGLDPVSRDDLLELFRELVKDGSGVFYFRLISHLIWKSVPTILLILKMGNS